MRNESLGEQIEESIRDREATKPLIDEITQLQAEVERLRSRLRGTESARDHNAKLAIECGTTIATLRGKIEKAIGKLNWMLAPGQTRKEAVEILSEALATPAQEDRANDA